MDRDWVDNQMPEAHDQFAEVAAGGDNGENDPAPVRAEFFRMLAPEAAQFINGEMILFFRRPADRDNVAEPAPVPRPIGDGRAILEARFARINYILSILQWLEAGCVVVIVILYFCFNIS